MPGEERHQLPRCRNQLPPEERMEQLNAAFDAVGEVLEQAELDDIAAAMTDKPRRKLSDLRGLGKDIGQGDWDGAIERDRDECDTQDPTKAEIMEDIRVGLRQAAACDGRPAREVFEETRRKTAGGTDPSA